MNRPHFPRFRVRTLMIAVAVIALACWAIPPWWRWHHEMLARSKNHAATSLRFARSAATYRRGVAKSLDTIDKLAEKLSAETGGVLPSRYAEEFRYYYEQCRERGRLADNFDAKACVYRRCVTFPWLAAPYRPLARLKRAISL